MIKDPIKNPLVLELIFTTKQDVSYLGKIETPSALDRDVIHQKGLYSTEFFGPIGSPQRMETFAYIDLGVEMIHPYLYLLLTTVSSLYEKILTSKEYVIFNKKTKTFDVSDRANGSTGYTYFLKHFNDLKIKESQSDDISNMVNVIKKYRKQNKLTSRYLLVLPAGMREIEIGDDDRVTEDEINDFYKAMVNVGNILSNASGDLTSVDYLRTQLQKKLQELFLYIRNIIDGKKGFMLGNWASRNVDYSTRTVLTGKSEHVKVLSDDMPDLINSSIVGIYQYANSIQPIAVSEMLNRFTSKVIDANTSTAYLYDSKSKKHITVNVSDKELLRFTTSKGLLSILNKLSDFDILNEEIMIDNHPLIIYTDVKSEITIYLDAQYIPEEHIDKIKYMTYGEMLYLSVYADVSKRNSTVTRYPITGAGSNTPTSIILHSTSNSREVELSMVDRYQNITQYPTVPKFPRRGEMWDNAFSAPYSRANGLGSDMDGDQVSSSTLMSKEANEQLENHRYKQIAYFFPNGKLLVEIEDSPAAWVASSLTRA